jgi:hypothetical protein
MPDSDYRALCAELLADYDNCHYRSELSDRAHAALAQPEPVAPTDEEMRALWRLGWQSKDPEDGAVLFAKEVLARWGTPANNTREEN